MGKLFGTDGIRGVVGENLTVELAFRAGKAIACVLREETGRRPFVTIGKDTRISSDMLEHALIAGLCAAGADVLPLGVLPTPAVAYLTVRHGADAGIVISASHNPYEHNGIKVFNEKGYKLPDATEAKVEEKLLSGEPLPERTRDEIGSVRGGAQQAREEYLAHLASTVSHDLSGLRVLVDCANGAASATAPDLFRRFRCDADFIHLEPNGVNINDRCGSTHLDALSRQVVAGGYDIALAFDGDADRCLMVDETGGIIDGDKIMAVCGAEMKRRGTLTGGTIVATVMSNLGLHEFCRASGIALAVTDVGDRHVLEHMVAHGFKLGGEQSGHMIFTDYATTGDGQLTALQFLQILAGSEKRASELASVCPKYPQVLLNVPVSAERGAKERIMASESLRAAIAREEEALGGEGRVLVRPSGTEALIRVMVEAKTEALARASAERMAQEVKE